MVRGRGGVLGVEDDEVRVVRRMTEGRGINGEP
jgi:hypothetical protein